MPVLRSLIDGHAHSQFSWDASEGAMLESCGRAEELGLGGIAFTEHADLTDWVVPAGAPIDPDWVRHLDGETLRLPLLDIEPYLAAIDQCRRHHPGLIILSGVEISEPHWHPETAARWLGDDRLDRVLSSVHAGPVDGGASEVSVRFAQLPADEVIVDYLAEVNSMIETSDVRVLAHIDYAARYWPAEAGPYEPGRFEAEHRRALAALAQCGGVLEINARRPLEARILDWWVQERGRLVSFGSDSHAPATVGAGLEQAAKLAAGLGFRPAGSPDAPWRIGRD